MWKDFATTDENAECVAKLLNSNSYRRYTYNEIFSSDGRKSVVISMYSYGTFANAKDRISVGAPYAAESEKTNV